MYKEHPYPSQVCRKMGMGQYKSRNISAVSTASVSQISESRPSRRASLHSSNRATLEYRAPWPPSLPGALCKCTVSFGTPKHCNDSRHSKHQLEACGSQVQSSCSLIWTETSEEPSQNSSHLERFHTYAFSWAASSALETFL